MPKNLPGHCYGKVALPRPSPDHFSPIYQIKKKKAGDHSKIEEEIADSTF
jgi:hypothetical protein